MIWKYIEGYEGIYKVSDTGEIFSIKSQKLLRQHLTCGYLKVKLCKDGTSRNHRVHRLVAEAFIETSDKNLLVLHSDNNKTNNLVSNLRWGTDLDNWRDFEKSGEYGVWLEKTKAFKTTSRKMSESDVRFIKDNYVSGCPEFGRKPMAEKFGKTPQYIGKILSNKLYADV